MICPMWKIICDYEVLHRLTVRHRGEKKNLMSTSGEQKQIQDFKGNSQNLSQYFISHISLYSTARENSFHLGWGYTIWQVMMNKYMYSPNIFYIQLTKQPPIYSCTTLCFCLHFKSENRWR